jgi:hypothetical protein
VTQVTTNELTAPNGHEVIYRVAGDRSWPTITLPHHFSSSNSTFRNLIPLLPWNWRRALSPV